MTQKSNFTAVYAKITTCVANAAQLTVTTTKSRQTDTGNDCCAEVIHLPNCLRAFVSGIVMLSSYGNEKKKKICVKHNETTIYHHSWLAWSWMDGAEFPTSLNDEGLRSSFISLLTYLQFVWKMAFAKIGSDLSRLKTWLDDINLSLSRAI